MATPVQIEVILYYYSRPDDWPQPWSPAHCEAIDRYARHGLLKRAPHGDERVFMLSEGGAMYVKALMAVPFPQQVTMWRITGEPS